MAILNKEQYAARNERAAERMVLNAEITTLTPEQHEFLAELCRMRHEIHCSQRSVFLSESAFYPAASKYLMECKAKSQAVGFALQVDSFDYVPSDWSFGEGLEPYETIEEAEEECLDWLGKWNNDVESFLRAIDRQHGTNYCPCGRLRI